MQCATKLHFSTCIDPYSETRMATVRDLSGLYGLLRPLERIQAYSCHLLDHQSISNVWKEDRLEEAPRRPRFLATPPS